MTPPSSGGVNGAVDSTATHQAGIGGIDDGIEPLGCDVAPDRLHPHIDHDNQVVHRP